MGAIAFSAGSVHSNPHMHQIHISRWVVQEHAWYALLLCRTLTSLTLLQHEHTCCQLLLLRHPFAYDTTRLNVCCRVQCLMMDRGNS